MQRVLTITLDEVRTAQVDLLGEQLRMSPEEVMRLALTQYIREIKEIMPELEACEPLTYPLGELH